MTLASFIELIAKIKQKNNGTFKLVDAQDVECEDGKGLDEVLNEKLDKNQGVENAGKTMVVGADGNLVVGDSSPKNVYTKEEVDYLLDDKMDKPYVPIEVTDNATITDALAGNLKIDMIKGNTYQNVETDIVPIPQRPVPINSRKVLANGEYVELRSLKETGNLFDINFIKLWGNYSDGMTILDDGTVKVTNNDATLWPLKTKSITIPKSANYTIKYDFETISGGANSGWISLVNMSNDNQKIFSTSGKTLYLDAGDYYVRFYRGQGATDVENNIVQYSNIVLVEGTSAPSTYVAPTVRDYKIVDHTTQTSKIVRNVNQFELPTDFSWNDTDYYPSISGNVLPEDKKGVYDTRVYNLINYTTEPYFGYSNTSGLYLGFSECDTYWELNNSDEVNAFLTRVKEDGKPFIFQYQLATPVEETIAYVETDTSEVGYSWQDTTSPSPTIKSEIKGVEEIDILKTGKNLFDFSKIKEIDGLTIDYENKTITLMANVNNAGYVNNLKDLMGGYKIGEKYVMSAKTSNPEALRIIYFLDIKNNIKFDEPFTLTEEMLNSPFAWYNNIESENQNVISNIQIEQSDTATAYEPYTEQHVNITLPKPLYENDVANVESGEYEYCTKNTTIDFNRFDGNLDLIQDNTVRYYFHKSFVQELDGIILDTLLFDCFTNVNDDSDTIHFKIGGNNNEYIFMYIPRGHTDDVAYVKEYLSSLNPIANFAVETKTTQPIPEEDLTKLKSLKTNAGVNNIFVGGEVKPTIEARYPRDLALVQQQLEQKILLISDSLIDTQAKVLLQGGQN